MADQQVSILIPTHRTPELTKLCLRLLRKHTPADVARVIVIDNDSQDATVEYLRGLKWIELLERDISADTDPTQSHARALDRGFIEVDTPYVLSIHTDTLIKRPDWLDYLLHSIKTDPNCAGAGSWKLEHVSPLKRLTQPADKQLKAWFPRLKGRRQRMREQRMEIGEYLRSHCALYRSDLIRRHELSFVDDGISSTGRRLHQGLVDHGHKMVFLPSTELSKYLEHVNHATIILNPQLQLELVGGTSRPLAMLRGRRRMQRILDALDAEIVLTDTTLDL